MESLINTHYNQMTEKTTKYTTKRTIVHNKCITKTPKNGDKLKTN